MKTRAGAAVAFRVWQPAVLVLPFLLALVSLVSALLVVGSTTLASPTAAVSSGAPVVTASQLVADVCAYDGQRIALKGEVVGSLLPRGGYVWVNVGDGTTAMGVWLPLSSASHIRVTGGYAARGDLVEVTGVFSAACPAHGGDPDLHADSLKVLEPGIRRLPVVSPRRWGVAWALVLAGGAAALLAARR